MRSSIVRAMPMKNPPHPGELVREECLAPLGLTVTAGAAALGVSRKVLSDVVNGRAGISALMAIRAVEGVRRHARGLGQHAVGLRSCAGAQARAFALKLARVARRAA